MSAQDLGNCTEKCCLCPGTPAVPWPLLQHYHQPDSQPGQPVHCEHRQGPQDQGQQHAIAAHAGLQHSSSSADPVQRATVAWLCRGVTFCALAVLGLEVYVPCPSYSDVCLPMCSMSRSDCMQGAHEIQSYCLGHTSFVTCATFLSSPRGTVPVSGGGDGTIRYCRTVSPPHTCRLCPSLRTTLRSVHAPCRRTNFPCVSNIGAFLAHHADVDIRLRVSACCTGYGSRKQADS